MTQVVCFSDSAAVISAVRQGLTAEEVVVHTLPASRLTDELRQMVCALAPDLFLLELSQALDNPHIYFFLRSDHATRNIPVVLISAGSRLEQHAKMLEADGYLQRPFVAAQVQQAVSDFITPREIAVAA
jgi:CheY-like chemotaxis protein